VVLQCNARLQSAQWNAGHWVLAATGASFTADMIVNAAGAWADEVAQIAQVRPLGIQPYRRTIAQLSVSPAAPADRPLVIGLDCGFSFKPDPCVAFAGKPQLMLQFPELAIGGAHAFRLCIVDQAEACGGFEQREVAGVGRQFMVIAGMAQHQVLHHEFNIDDAAVIMFQVEQRAFVGMGIEHLVAHFQDAVTQCGFFPRRAQHLDAQLLEGAADCRVVYEAGGLRKTSPLRTACEKAKIAAAIGCYPDRGHDLARLIDQELGAAELTISPDARATLSSLIGGDRRASAIAAASIVAKVTRDRLMQVLHATDPRYGFDRHKGYATADHLSAVARFGYSPQHRRTFRPATLFDTIE